MVFAQYEIKSYRKCNKQINNNKNKVTWIFYLTKKLSKQYNLIFIRTYKINITF